MTELPPPPPGNYPPPPPGGYPPPPPPGGGFPPPQGPRQALPKEAYTPWLTRVLAYVIDALPIVVLIGIGYGILLAFSETTCVSDTSEYGMGDYCVAETSSTGMLAVGLCYLLAFVFGIWNYGYRQGTTGSSIGKSVLKFKVVSEKTGQPIGFGLSIVRQIAHIVDQVICMIGYLFPLWDSKRQTLADKIMTTVCLPL